MHFSLVCSYNIYSHVNFFSYGHRISHLVITHLDDLRQAREKATLKELASTQNDDQWSYTMRNCAHIIRTILRGIVHLNRNNYQHYDIKGKFIYFTE